MSLIAKAEKSPDEQRPTLMDGRVISVKEEWSLVVGNIGEQAGSENRDAVAGDAGGQTDRDAAGGGCAPENLRRGDSGNGFGERKIKVGDRLQVDARQNVSLK